MKAYLQFSIILYLALVSSCLPVSNNNAPTRTVLPVMPVMARKAGGNWRPELVKNTGSEISTTTASPEEEEEFYYDSSEESCPDNMFFHVRGRHCVPKRCKFGGEQNRDPHTGKCLAKDEDYSGGGGYYYYKQGKGRKRM